MPLSSGTRLGVYEILAAIGEGGMGQVYRARDTRLNRTVAIKVLPDLVAADPERLARFEREAQLLASINHPHIAQVHGFEDASGVAALVMEHVDGETLADRIAHGAMPVDTALTIAKQIADAVAAAHEQGIVHRDLKPANIKIRPDGTVKVLDFGLAKVFDPSPSSKMTRATITPTLPAHATAAGIVLGTTAYMSPEQARGLPVDQRTDVWAFGCVCYEMLTGRAAFGGPTSSDTIAAVLEREPDWPALPAAVPAHVRWVLRRCVEKDASRRLWNLRDVRLLMDEAPPVATESVAPRRSWLPWAVAALFAIALAGSLIMRARGGGALAVHALRFDVDLGPDANRDRNLAAAISPDGTRLVVVTRAADGRTQLSTRLLSEQRLVAMDGTTGAAAPFFSPDGQWIGFVAGGQIKKVAARGGAVIAICDAPLTYGASWGDDDQIVFAAGVAGPLSSVPAAGGRAQAITRVGANGDAAHRWPHVLPGGKTVLFTSHKIVTGFDDATIEAVTLGSGERKTLVRGGYSAKYIAAPDGSGQLLFVREGVLFAVPFDVASLQLRGTPAPLIDDVAGDSDSGRGQYDVARNGIVIYRSGKGPARTWPVLWLDRAGKTEPLIAEPAAYYIPTLSPDGTRVALTLDRGDKGRDIAVYDIARGVTTRLTMNADVNLFPAWSPDGKYLLYETATGRGYGIGAVRAEGSGQAQLLAEHDNLMIPTSFTPDGRQVALYEQNEATGFDIYTASFDASDVNRPKLGTPQPLLNSRYGESQGSFSPDGRWIAYASTESGRQEVYVQPFGRNGAKTQISRDGGNIPMWSQSRRELFFRSATNRMMAADYTIAGDAFVASPARQLSPFVIGATIFGRDYSVAPDGNRFAILAPREDSSAANRTTLVTNVIELLRR